MPGARIYKAGTPYNGVDLAELDYEQTADVMYLAHIDHEPGKLQRFGHTNWTFASLTFGPTIAAPGGVAAVATSPNTDAENEGAAYFPQTTSYVVTSVDADSGQESRASASASCENDLTLKRNYNTVTWNAVANVERYRVYKQDNTAGYGWVGDTVNLTFRDDNIAADLTDSPPIGFNPFEGDGNKPSTVTFFEQRLLWARTRIKPNGVFGSKSADYENHDRSRPTKADDGLSFALLGRRVNAVNQMVGFSAQGLVCLSSDGVYVVKGSGDYLSAAEPPVSRRQSGRGVSRLNPLELDAVVFFKTNVGNEVRALGYSFEIDGVKTNDVTIFSPHLFAGFDIIWWAYAEVPRSIIWAGRSDGKLLCFTWEQDQQVWGWTLCETDGFAASGCVIPENGEDRLYLTVWRTVGGVRRLYIERMASVRWGDPAALDGAQDVADAIYLDCAVSYDLDASATVLGRLHHLEGRTVNALADGNVITGLVVADGRIELPYAVTKAVVGLPYVALVETLPLVLQTQGTNQGRRQQAAEAVVRLVDSRGIEAGPSDDLLLPVMSRPVTADYGDPDPLGTGDYDVQMQPDVKRETVIVVRQALPLPMTLTAAYLDPVVTG